MPISICAQLCYASDKWILQCANDDSFQSRTAVYTSHNPAGTSTQNVMHMAQLIRSGLCQKYDYGNPWLNLQHYGQVSKMLDQGRT